MLPGEMVRVCTDRNLTQPVSTGKNLKSSIQLAWFLKRYSVNILHLAVVTTVFSVFGGKQIMLHQVQRFEMSSIYLSVP